MLWCYYYLDFPFVSHVYKFVYMPLSKFLRRIFDEIQKFCFRGLFIKTKKMPSSNKIHSTFYTFQLNINCNYEEDILKVTRGSVVVFSLGPSLYGSQIKFFINAPEGCKPFIRDKYRHVPLTTEGETAFAKIPFETPGSYHFYIVIDDKKDCLGYILVEPDLYVGSKLLPLNSLKCVTVISKCLGPLSSWSDKMAAINKCGYNMVHFTPIQKLGGSNSAYSICDQLSLNPLFYEAKKPVKITDVKTFTDRMKKDYKMLAVCDIVLNHTANETVWLQDHPECAYNLINSPHLRPAYVLDALLHKLTIDVSTGLYENRGVPASIDCEQHLEALRHLLWNDILNEAKLHEMFTVDTAHIVDSFKTLCTEVTPSPASQETQLQLSIIQDPLYRRLKSAVDMDIALKLFNVYWNDCYDEDSRQRRCTETFKQKLDELNAEITSSVNNHLDAAVNNTIATVRYFRLQDDGPKLRDLSLKNPLVPRYFIETGEVGEEQLALGGKPELVMAHNGWVMGDDPLRNFAESHSNVYLRRELIAWGDSVKLRYGESPSDCPFLWTRMKEYVELTAMAFDGVRLDNCHSTPLHVAQYLLDAAREVKPNLFVIAELFTNSDKTDNVFVNKLGITCLIRESMSAWDSHELGRLVYRYGGRAVGSLRSLGTRLAPGVAPALFLDLTHDNLSPVDRRSVYDLLPSAALVAMASTATGSNYGYDHLVPHHIHVVDESRKYMGLKEEVDFKCMGITEAKAFLNNLHSWLAENNYDQVFVDQIDSDIVCVTRHNSSTLESYLMFSYTSFQCPTIGENKNGSGKGVTVMAGSATIEAEAYLQHKSGNRYSKVVEFSKDEKFINGLSEFVLNFQQNVNSNDSEMVTFEQENDKLKINLTENFQPGSIVVVKIFPTADAKRAVTLLNSFTEYETKLQQYLSFINLVDINYILFKCSEEEPGGTYNIPGFGNLVYAGLQGIMSVMEEIVEKDDQAHPVCSNIREGNWLADFIGFRLMKNIRTRYFGEIVKQRLDLLKDLPLGMKPFYFYSIISATYSAVKEHAFSLMSPFVKEGNELVKTLALSSLQFVGQVESCSLPHISERILPPNGDSPATIAAGLPHFSNGYMRSWGRDTFISLRGLLLLTGRFQEARYHILGYGACLRHGLIPNLLDSGKNPRFNCRDAVWWWLQSIKSYVELSPNGIDILKDPVHRLFQPKDLPSLNRGNELLDVMQECLRLHFQGMCFRELNAGRQIDEHMTNFGFYNRIGVHPQTGFVFGGNEWNCGTWMDKMGSSQNAGTAGRPATPRDGSAVELVALSYSVVSWLKEIHANGHYPYSGVLRIGLDGNTAWSWVEWCALIKRNFETEFWVGESVSDPLAKRKNIYKDTLGSLQPWADFRLRPNFVVAMAVAPDLFEKHHSIRALEVVDKVLLGPLGIKTLDPADEWYAPNYDNSDDSCEAKTSHGFNYHQGPEWVWPMGSYLRMILLLRGDVNKVKKILAAHWMHASSSPWRGLPELTNDSGTPCAHSCPTQAWSVATILEALYDLHQIENNAPR